MTIHQPSSRLFYMFHKLLLLSEGNALYFGKVSAVMDYFSNIGFASSVPMNPADFLLDLANGLTSDGAHANKSMDDHMQSIVVAYKERLSEKLKEELAGKQFNEDKLSNGPEDNSKEEFGRWPTTWWQHFSVLLRRGVRERKHESFSPLKIFEVLAVSLLTALLWWKSHISHLQDQNHSCQEPTKFTTVYAFEPDSTAGFLVSGSFERRVEALDRSSNSTCYPPPLSPVW